MPLSARQCVELFHLVFLRAFAARGEERALFALKGGCNLRFFFGSIRYSEDIDIDAAVIATGTLRNKVDRLLRSPAIVSPLRAQGIELVEATAPQQTETTQRWKAGLHSSALGATIRTKIEFSRRDAIDGTSFEAVGREVLRPYSLGPVLATHYAAPKAIAKKIRALAGRPEPQARDVFDLSHLLARADMTGLTLRAEEKSYLSRAIESAIAISFDAYVSQVVSYLDPEQAEPFASRIAWEAMQEDVVARLEVLA